MKYLYKILLTLILTISLIISPVQITAQSGVLIPSSVSEKPDAKVLSLAVMNVEILIDNQHATVKVLQIFDNHTSQTLEGKYLFALPQKSSISDFAVWDNDLRIPGVMMEKKRANAIYAQIKQTQIDPGILQQTDETESEKAFSARIFPINANGTKRLEMEYTEDLAVENLNTHFIFPLKPSYGEEQTVGEFNLKLTVLNSNPITPIFSNENPYPLQIVKNETGEFIGEFHAKNIQFNKDFSFDYQINTAENNLSIIAYRAPEKISVYDLRDPKLANPNPDGYFQTTTIFSHNELLNKPPKRVVIMLDTSLSMYGDKLIRSVESIDYFLHNLKPEDKFNLILFNDEAVSIASKPISATTENIEKAIKFIENSTLGGGTNLKNGFREALSQSKFFSDENPNIILISDANSTLETTKTKSILELFKNQATKVFVFAIGSDANTDFLTELTTKTHGYFDQIRETEDISLRLKILFDKIGSPNIENLKLADTKNFYDVYSSGENSFSGSSYSFIGRYKTPQTQTVNFTAQLETQNINLTKKVTLPEFDETHIHLPRLWARAKVNALLQAMNRDGEREDYISEIIRLSEKYKFVTPYTAFLAAPRALLRPRLIQPGDPVIRVKTDSSITEVFAILPFGETLPLKYLQSENVWETRFLAPVWMADGVYKCRLLLKDKNGIGYQEEKTFVVDSRAPKVRINLPSKTFQAGESIQLKVSADSDTNRLIAKVYGAKPIQLYWSNEEKSNVGILQVPNNLASGKYILTITAEDFAHNQSTEQIQIEVLEK